MLPLLTSTLPAVAVLDENNKRDVWTEKTSQTVERAKTYSTQRAKTKTLDHA